MSGPTVLNLPAPNLPLLRKVLDHIDTHPEQWKQEVFGDPRAVECGTAMCVGGWAIEFTRPPDARCCPWSEGTAQDALGLTDKERDDMFYNTLNPPSVGLGEFATVREAVQAVAERIAARAGEML